MWTGLGGQEEGEEALEVHDDLHRAELGLSEDSVDKGDGDLGDGVVQLAGLEDHVHLEDVPLGLDPVNNLSQDLLLVEPEAPREV